MAAYSAEDWKKVIEDMEKGVASYLETEEVCRRGCEAAYSISSKLSYVSLINRTVRNAFEVVIVYATILYFFQITSRSA